MTHELSIQSNQLQDASLIRSEHAASISPVGIAAPLSNKMKNDMGQSEQQAIRAIVLQYSKVGLLHLSRINLLCPKTAGCLQLSNIHQLQIC
jgi:hypothetical protein